MRYIDSQPTSDVLALVGRQIIVGERVMQRLGHAVRLWESRTAVDTLLALPCLLCGQEAKISLLEMAGGAEYSIMVFPEGMCRCNSPQYT
jgi:hypothetical protein